MIIFAGVGFLNIPGKYENVVFITKILETGINVFKSNSQIMKNTKIMKYQLFTNASKNNRWLLFVISEWFVLELNWFVYNPSWMLHLCSLVLVVFKNFLLIDATDRSKISSDQKHLFFAIAYTPFHFSQTLPLTSKINSIHFKNYIFS